MLYVPAWPGGTMLKTWPPLQSSNVSPTGPCVITHVAAIIGGSTASRPTASMVTSPIRSLRSIIGFSCSRLRSRARSGVRAPGVRGHALARVGHRRLPGERQHPDLRRLRVARPRRTRSDPGGARELGGERTRVSRSRRVARRPVDARALDVRRVAAQAGGIGVAVEAVLGVRGGLVGEVAVRRIAEEAVVGELVLQHQVALGIEKAHRPLLDAALAVRDRRRRLGVGEVVHHDAPRTLVLDPVVHHRIEHPTHYLDPRADRGLSGEEAVMLFAGPAALLAKMPY